MMNEKVFLVVKCKDCKHRQTENCPMRFEEVREGNDSHGFPYGVRLVHNRTTDEGFCHLGEK